jgi:hypothetical protein
MLVLSASRVIASKGWINWKRDFKGTGRDLYFVASGHLPGRTDETHGKPQSCLQVSDRDSIPAIHEWVLRVLPLRLMSRDSAVGIATGYGLDDWEVRVRVPVGSRIFTSSCCPDRLCGPPNLLHNGYRGLFPGGKAAGAWSWPLTSN